MSLLSSVTTGKQVGAQINVIMGNNGTGKTTFCAAFPQTIILDLEDGSSHLNVARLGSDKLKTLDDVRAVLKELLTSDYKSVALDSIESLEGLINDFICKEGNVISIEKYDGGYGKGFTRGREIMRDLFEDFKALRKAGITVNLTAHTQVKPFTDPVKNEVYDRVVMRCNDKLAAVVRDLSDNVLYCTYKVHTVTEKNKKTQAFGDGQRVMFTQWRPGFDAKNRLDLPYELPLSFDEFQAASNQKPSEQSDQLLSDINEMIPSLDAQMQTAVKASVEKFKTNPTKLREIKNRAMTYLNK